MLNKSISINLNIIINSIIFSVLATIMTYFISNELSIIKYIIASIYGFVYSLFIFSILHLFLKKYFNLIVTILFVYYIVYISIFKIFGMLIDYSYIQVLYINGINNFIEISGLKVVDILKFSLIIFIIGLIYFQFIKFISSLKNIIILNLKFKYFIIFVFIVSFIDYKITYKKLIQSPTGTFSIYAKSILLRYSPNIDVLYYRIKDKKFNNKDTIITTNINKQLPNIVIIMVESLRSDAIDNMLNIKNYEGTYFKYNYSTSNGTYFGLFSTLYGLYPNYYWQTIENIKPTIVEFCEQLNYKTIFYSSDKLTYGDEYKWIKKDYFDKFNIINNNDLKTYQRDNIIFKELENDLSKNYKPKCIVFQSNTTHFDYSFNKDELANNNILLEPYTKNALNFFDLANLEKKKDLIFNKYKNSVRYFDLQLNKFILSLKTNNLWDNTLLVVFGDHGEEFWEEGHYTHASSLNKYQLNSFLYMHTPKDNKFTISDKTVSIVDIPKSIISYIDNNYNVTTKNIEFLNGYNILSSKYVERPVISTDINPKEKSTNSFFNVNFKDITFKALKIDNNISHKQFINNLRKDYDVK